MLSDAITSVAKSTAQRMPLGVSEKGVGRCLRAELEARGYVVDCEQPVVLKYTVSTGVELCVQTNYIDFVVRDLSSESTVGIELKHARVVSAAHIRQAEGYSKALEIPVAAVAMAENGAEVKLVTSF